MKLRIARTRRDLRSSLWFIPSLCVAGAFVLAEAALRIDRRLDPEGADWFLFGGGIESARQVVDTIATSMLTFTGLVFTVTMLVLQLASNQLSPRVMRTFLRDRGNQTVLGVFIGTFVYALLVLRRITTAADGEPFVPALSVWLALVLVLLCIGLFVYYIHHIAQSIRPVAVMERVAAETRHALDQLYPAGVGESTDPEAQSVTPAATAVVVSPGPSGLLTGVDEERIVRAARDAGCVIELRACVGDFVREGAPLFTVRGPWDGTAAGAIQASVGFGWERTMDQDAGFGFRQLVDIAQRALSPGINDPTTAVQAIDHVHGLLGRLVLRSMPSSLREVGGGAAVLLPRPGWSDYVTLACDEIRRAGEGQLQIQRRLRAMLIDLLEVAPADRRGPLEEQLALLDANLEPAFRGTELARAATPSAQGHGPAWEP